MHWKDVVLTAHQHIHVQSALAQGSSGLRIIHSEKLKKRVCLAVTLISGFQKKIKLLLKGSEMTMKGKNVWALRKSLNAKTAPNVEWKEEYKENHE